MTKDSLISLSLATTLLLQGFGAGMARADASHGVFTPAEIPLSAPDIPNPMRGYVQDGNVPGDTMNDYQRFDWSEIEKERDVYDFTPIENVLTRAAAAGKKASFRFRSSSRIGVNVPDYMVPLLEKGWWYDMDNNGTKESFVPDWNDPDYIDRARAFIKAIGARYDGDPRIAWIDIGMYGRWGEWHLSPYGDNLTVGAKAATPETKRALVDMHIEAFPHTRLVSMTADAYALAYAAWRSPEIGFRRDSIGYPGHFEEFDPALLERLWPNAPVIAEPIDNARIIPSAIPGQVKLSHASNINNINFSAMSAYSPQQQADIIMAGKLSGYRFVLKQLVYPLTWNAGSNVSLAADWVNRGVAPVYEPWDIMYQLRTANGDVVWQAASALNLQNLLPSDLSSPIGDTWKLPASLANGAYTLVMTVKDPNGYSRPMRLAIEGANADDSYTVGSVQVTGGTAPSGSAEPPVAVMGTLPASIEAGQFLQMSGISSYDPDGYIANYKWTVSHAVYGDVSLNDANAKKALLHEGLNTVKLTVTDGQGLQNSNEAQVQVTARTTPPPAEPVDHSTEPKPIPTPNPNPTPSAVVESFEDGVDLWQHAEDVGTVTIATYGDVPPGLSGQSARMTFDTTGTYQYTILRGLDGSSWVADGRDAIRFWMKGNPSNPLGSENLFSLQLREFNEQGERWTYNLGNLIRDPGWQQVVVPLDRSEWSSSGGTLNQNGTMDLKDVEQLRFYVRKSSSPIQVTIDQIEVINSSLLYPTSLRSIKVGANAIDGFSPDVTSYQVLLPEGTTVPPTVTASAYSSKASVTITQAVYLPGTVTLQVYAPGIAQQKTYTVKLNVPYYRLDRPEFTDWEGKPLSELKPGAQVRGKVTVTQLVYSDKPATVIVALYDGNGAMRDFVTAEKSMSLGEKMTFYAGLTVPDDGANYSIKTMVWEGLQTMQPLSTPYVFPYATEVVQVVENAEGGFSSWLKQPTTMTATAEASADTGDGSEHAMKLSFPQVNSFNYFYKAIDGAVWSQKGATHLRLWVKGSSNLNLAANKVKLQMRETSTTGERWSYDLSAALNKDGWQQIVIPLKQEAWTRETDGAQDNIMTLSKMADIRIFYNSVNRPITFLMDGVEVIKQ